MIANSNACGGQTGFINGSGEDCDTFESTPFVKATGATQLQLVIAKGMVSLRIFQKSCKPGTFHVIL